MTTLLNNKFFVIFLTPFLLGALTILGFSPYNFTFINFFSFSILLFLIFIIKKKTQSNYRKKKSKHYFFYLGCAFGFGFFLFGNYWISISLTHDDMFKGLIPFALILIPLFLSLFFGLAILFVGAFAEKNISFIILFSAKAPTSRIASPKNKDKNKGISTRARGIKPLNISSCVKDIEIQ